tara:strand:+ start:2070 stop:3482 length:1413 start_codon:yes stop_codon:yes gene_type:complete
MAIALPILGGLGAGAAGFFGFTLAATSLMAILIGGLIIVGAALLVGKMMKAKERADPGMLVNKNSNNDPIPLVYGERRVGATRTFIRTAGPEGETTSNAYLHILFTVCEGPIESIQEIYFNDTKVWDVASGISSSAGEDSIDFTGLLEITNHLGDQTTADANLVSRFPEWTADHVGNGIVYSYIRFKYNRDAFSGLPTVTFTVKGRKVRDVDNLAGGESYSKDPSNIIADYLTHPIYGRDFDDELLNTVSFQDAKSYYSVDHSFLDGARYILDGALSTDDTTYENTQRILACCNSALIFSNGRYKLIPFKTGNSTDIITETHIVDNWNMGFGDKKNRFNRVKVSFTNKDDDYQQGSAVIENSSFKTLDNNLVLQKEIGLDLIVEPDRAKLIANELMSQSRYDTTVELTLPHTKQTIEPMDVITFEHPYLPEEAPTLFRVLDVLLRADGTLVVKLQEYNGSVYTELDPATL